MPRGMSFQTTDLGWSRLEALKEKQLHYLRDCDPSFEQARYQSMMQSTASLPIPGILGDQPKPVNITVREPRAGRKFRA